MSSLSLLAQRGADFTNNADQSGHIDDGDSTYKNVVIFKNGLNVNRNDIVFVCRTLL